MPPPESAPQPRPAFQPLAARVGAWLALHDPGGVDTNRALHLGTAILIVIMLGYALAPWLPPHMVVTFPLMAGVGAVVSINAVPAASRRAEMHTFGRLWLINSGCLFLFILVGPGEGHANAMAQKAMLIPISFAALLLRRYGMEGQRIGIALVVVASVDTILAPTRVDALLLLVAMWIGMLVAVGLRRSPWRPSAVNAYVATVYDMQAAVAQYLREMSDAVRAGQPFPPERTEAVEAKRAPVWNALANATAEAPEARADFEALRVKVYRLRVAVQLLASCIPDNAPTSATRANAAAAEAWRPPFAAAADHLARWLENIDVHDVHSQDRFNRACDRIRELAFSSSLPPASRFALMRALTAFDRLSLVIGGIEKTESAPFPPPHPEAVTRPEPGSPVLPLLLRAADGRSQASPILRVALQGAIGTSLTTLLDFTIGLNHAYWATMTVMFVMGNSVGETYMRARYRFVGTLVGVLIGIAFMLVVSEGLLPLVLLGTAAQIVSVVTARDRYDISSAAVGFSVVLGLHIITGLDTEGMLARIYETAIGAVVALAVSWFVLPVYLTDDVRPKVLALVRSCRAAFAGWWPHRGERASVGPLVQEVHALGIRLPQMSAESVFGHSAGDVATLVTTLDVLLTYLALIEDSCHRLALLPQQSEVVATVEAARIRTLAAFDATLGTGAPFAAAAGQPALDAAISTVLGLADDPDVESALPLVADYLGYSEAVLRPMREIGIALSDQSPWTKEHSIATVPAKAG